MAAEASNADSKREPLLLLVHRIPFPPDKGDKIRSFRILEYLAKDYDVHLGCFIDDPDDWQHVETLEQYCVDVKAIGINRRLATLRSARGFLTGLPLSVPFYASKAMQRWVDGVLSQHAVRNIMTYSSPMAQFVSGAAYSKYRRTMDLVDVDSDKWRQYAERTRFPMRQVYHREWRRLAEYERRIAKDFDAVTLVTENETRLFDDLSPETKDKHFAIANGVDTAAMNPDQDYESPYDGAAPRLVFVGMMNYWANEEAVAWFAREVLPKVHAVNDAVEFWIVGGSPTEPVKALGALAGVTVTGRVADVRPYIKHATVAVAPLRIARGIQNKVLEYLAMGRPTVCSKQAASGLADTDGAPMIVADDAAETAAACLQLINAPASDGTRERAYVMEHYDWGRNLSRLGGIVSQQPGAVTATAND